MGCGAYEPVCSAKNSAEAKTDIPMMNRKTSMNRPSREFAKVRDRMIKFSEKRPSFSTRSTRNTLRTLMTGVRSATRCADEHETRKKK